MRLPDFLIPVAAVMLFFAASLAWPHARKCGQVVLSVLSPWWPRLWKLRWIAVVIAGGAGAVWLLRPLIVLFFQREDVARTVVAAIVMTALFIGACRVAWLLRNVLATALIFLICGGAGFTLGGMVGASLGVGYAAPGGLFGMLFGGMFALALVIADSKK